MTQANQTELSLLWPNIRQASGAAVQPLFTTSADDLRLAELVRDLAPTPRSRDSFLRALRQVVSDPDIIRYRQDIVSDLLADEALADAFATILPQLDGMTAQPFTFRKRHALYDVVERLGELDLYVTAVQAMVTAFEQATEIHSSGLTRLHDFVATIAADPAFATLVAELPELQKTVRQVASVTIGVNLNHELKPVGATLLTVNGDPFTESSMLSRIFGRTQATSTSGKLHKAEQFNQASVAELKAALGGSNPQIMMPLFADLADVLEKVSQPVARALRAYSDVTTATLVNLRDELAFYVDAVRVCGRMRELGLPMVRPTIAPAAATLFSAENAYNLHLALHHRTIDDTLDKAIISNDISCDASRRIIILTGPNGGGKTTWLQSVGLIQLLAQAGLPVPASAATISPVDNVYTHYQGEENPAAGTGRFGEEALRLQHIFKEATAHSLLLLNESLASTSSGESLYLAQDIVALFGRIGLRAVFATHLHELAAKVDALNAEQSAPCIVSMVASMVQGDKPNERTFKVRVGPPIGHSYAKELAARYGISAEQLTEMLERRGVFKEG